MQILFIIIFALTWMTAGMLAADRGIEALNKRYRLPRAAWHTVFIIIFGTVGGPIVYFAGVAAGVYKGDRS